MENVVETEINPLDTIKTQGTFVTKYGEIDYKIHDAQNIWIGSRYRGDQYLTVRNIPHTINIGAEPINGESDWHYENGKNWRIRIGSIYIRRADQPIKDLPTDSCKKAIIEEILVVLETITPQQLLKAEMDSQIEKRKDCFQKAEEASRLLAEHTAKAVEHHKLAEKLEKDLTEWLSNGRIE